MKKIGIFGCTGFLGRLVAQEIMESIKGQPDLRLVLAGRDKFNLERLSMDLGRRYKQPVDIHICTGEDRQALRLLCEPCDVIVSCVAPYGTAGANLLVTAIHGKAHLLDASTEAPHVADCIAKNDAAVGAGIAVVNSLGVRSALAAAAAEVASRTFQGLERVSVLYMFQNPPDTPGTRRVLLQTTSESTRVLVDGRIREAAYGSQKKVFTWPGGKGSGSLAGGSEAMHISRRLKAAKEIQAYTQSQGVKGLLLPMMAKVAPGFANLPPVQKWVNTPERPTSDSSSFAVIVELEAPLGRRFAVLQGQRIYDTTARLLGRAAMRLLTEDLKLKGVLAPCEAFKPEWVLETAGLELQTADTTPA